MVEKVYQLSNINERVNAGLISSRVQASDFKGINVRIILLTFNGNLQILTYSAITYSNDATYVIPLALLLAFV